MLMIDQAAKLIWTDFGGMRQRPRHGKLLFNSRNRDFETVTNAVLFAMEQLDSASRATALIQTDGASLQEAEIEAVYKKIKN